METNSSFERDIFFTNEIELDYIKAPSPGIYVSGDDLLFTVTYTDEVFVSGTPSLKLTLAGNNVTVDYVSGSGTPDLIFSYTLAANDFDLSGSLSLSPTIELNDGSISNESLLNAPLDFTAPDLSEVYVSYSNFALWLDANQLSLNDTDPVDTWNDLSGSDNDATQSTPSNQPRYNTNVVNSLPAINFDGSNYYLEFSSLINMQPATIFIVGRYNLPQVNASYIGNDTNNSFVGYYGGSVYYYSTLANMNTASTLPTLFQIYTAHAQPPGNTSSIRINGTQVRSGNYNWGASTIRYISRRNAERLRGDIAEIIIFSTNLSSDEINAVEGYLSDKYNITIP